MKFLLTAIFVFNFLKMTGQAPFEKIYGGINAESLRSVAVTSSGQFIAGGTTQSFGNSTINSPDYYLIKTNMNGGTLWTKTFGDSSDNYGRNVLETTDHNYVMSGYSYNLLNNSYDFYVVKTNTDGVKIWERYFGGIYTEMLYDALAISGGRIILCGSTLSFGNGGNDIYLVEIDSAGNILRENSIGEAGNEVAVNMEPMKDGGYAITGYTNSFTPDYDIYLVETDSDLNVKWSRNFGANGNDYGYDVKEDNQSNLILLGDWENSLDTSNIVFIETDSLGLNPFMKFPGSHEGDLGFSLNKTSDNGFVIAGYTQVPGKGSEMLLLKIDSNGDTLQNNHFGGIKNEVAFNAIPLSDNGYLIAGETEGFGIYNLDGYLVRVDSQVTIPCPDSITFITSSDELCEDEHVFFTNTTVSSQDFTWLQDGAYVSGTDDAAIFFNESGEYNITLEACDQYSSAFIKVNPKPPTSFSYSVSNDSTIFKLNPAVIPASIYWNFGDGTTDTSHLNPSHLYAYPGMYWVLLSVVDSNGCDSLFKNQIDVLSGIDNLTAEKCQFFIYPIPSAGEINILWKNFKSGSSKLQVLNVTGELVAEIPITGDAGNDKILMPYPGIYFINVGAGVDFFRQKLIIQ
ncbi:MAG: T9SS type A sorting domain-containing protein [Chitinophagales bacterium]|nr:T9SS type A sorting domain-containing protein [Chitinophagales bacterium]